MLMRRQPLRFVTEFDALTENDKLGADYARATNWLLNAHNLQLVADEAGLRPDQVVAEEVWVDFVPIGAEISVRELLDRPRETETAVRNSPYLRSDDGQIEMMIADPSSLLRVLSTTRLRMTRLYLDGTESEANQLREVLKERMLA